MSTDFKVGDAVQFVKVTHRGRSIDMSTKYGTITEIIGAYADVRVTSRQTCRVELSALKRKGERGHLTEALMGPETAEREV